jgi:hypothetical protein
MPYHHLSRKQQIQIAEENRKLVIKSLYELLDAMQNSPARRRYSPFPFGQMERCIEGMLDVIERKWLQKRWAAKKISLENR